MIDHKNIIREIIREIESYEFSLVAYYNGEKVFALESSGVSELTKFIVDHKEDFKNLNGLMIGDKIVGKASALLLLNLKPSFIYGSIMSEKAREVLEGRGIELKYKSLVPNILNRSKTGVCPMEKLILNINSPREALNIFEEFFNNQIAF